MFYRPVGLKERGTGHVLFDLDKTTHAMPREAQTYIVNTMIARVLACPLFSGVASVVRTSDRGVQVVAVLRRFRWDVVGFYRSRAVRAALMAVGLDLASLLGGATVDRSAWAPSRLARLPGWRVKDGWPMLATLWHESDDPIRLLAPCEALPTATPSAAPVSKVRGLAFTAC